MRRYVIEDTRHVPPFNEPASLLTIGVKPLKIHHEELFVRIFKQSMELPAPLHSRVDLLSVQGEAVVYRDSLWFDDEFLQYFMEKAWATGQACRAAIPADDPAFKTYTLPLATTFEFDIDQNKQSIILLDLWYFPKGFSETIVPVVVPSDAQEMGFYSVPDFMTMEQGDLTHYAPMRAVMSIESWVHVYFASVIFGNFGRAGRFDRKIKEHNFFSFKLLWKSVLEQKHLLSNSETIKIGKGTNIHSTAVITGPASIGENCNIGPGVFLDNCTIGDNVTIDDGCVLMMSTVGNGCFLPFRASLYLTSVMENTIVAQNTCLQMCVLGRNSFVGAGNTFTDFNLMEQKAIRAANISGHLEEVGQVVLGSAVGHNCRVGSGMVIFPGRMIESDVVIVASPQRRVISRSVTYEESDHHVVGAAGASHKRQYPRKNEAQEQIEWDKW